MTLTFEPEAPPLRVDEAGAIRVGQTRVLMALVVGAFRNGETPEEIVRMYPTVSLAEVYGVIAYYLRHRAEVEEFVVGYARECDELRQKMLADQKGLRERLFARQRVGPTAEAV